MHGIETCSYLDIVITALFAWGIGVLLTALVFDIFSRKG